MHHSTCREPSRCTCHIVGLPLFHRFRLHNCHILVFFISSRVVVLRVLWSIVAVATVPIIVVVAIVAVVTTSIVAAASVAMVARHVSG